jgi:hypothetical protein
MHRIHSICCGNRFTNRWYQGDVQMDSPAAPGIHPRSGTPVMNLIFRRLAPAVLTLAMAALVVGFATVSLVA